MSIVQISLTKGQVAIVDESDYHLVADHQWIAALITPRNPSIGYYAVRYVGKYRLPMHRVILGLDRYDPRMPDHRDGNGLNNTRGNLRIATSAQNRANQRKYAGCKCSRYKGVQPSVSRKNPWRAYIGGLGAAKMRHIGVFLTEEAAARAYDAEARRVFGEFARLNFPES